MGRFRFCPLKIESCRAWSYLIFCVVNVETKLQRPVKHVRLGEAEADAFRQVSDAGLDLKRLAQAEEVVGRIVDADEGAFQSAHAAVQADAVLALFMDLQRQVDQAVFLVQLANRGVGIVGLQLVEVSQLIQAQQAQLPEARVVDVAFFQRDLAPDHLVARGGVALELDAAHIELLAFVDVDVEKDQLLIVVELGVGNRSEVDVAQFAIGLAQVLDALWRLSPC